MAEQTDIKLPSPTEIKANREPVGLRVLGTVDPRTLTEEQFYMSPDLLYHGSKIKFQFRREFDYDDRDYLTEFDGSATLGMGFYTTLTSKDAQDYSHVRSLTDKDTPFVTAILPYQAKMLDLRRKDGLITNGTFPANLAERWQEEFQTYFSQMQPKIHVSSIQTDPDSPISWGSPKDYNYEFHKEYSEYLKKLIEKGDYNLRQLLMTGMHPDLPGYHDFPSPPWALRFSQFMIQQGYDGVICIEGSEKDKSQTATSIVFYNLEKIGDYETWHPDEDSTHLA